MVASPPARRPVGDAGVEHRSDTGGGSLRRPAGNSPVSSNWSGFDCCGDGKQCRSFEDEACGFA